VTREDSINGFRQFRNNTLSLPPFPSLVLHLWIRFRIILFMSCATVVSPDTETSAYKASCFEIFVFLRQSTPPFLFASYTSTARPEDRRSGTEINRVGVVNQRNKSPCGQYRFLFIPRILRFNHDVAHTTSIGIS